MHSSVLNLSCGGAKFCVKVNRTKLKANIKTNIIVDKMYIVSLKVNSIFCAGWSPIPSIWAIRKHSTLKSKDFYEKNKDRTLKLDAVKTSNLNFLLCLFFPYRRFVDFNFLWLCKICDKLANVCCLRSHKNILPTVVYVLKIPYKN